MSIAERMRANASKNRRRGAPKYFGPTPTNVGGCERQIWYQVNNYSDLATDMDVRARFRMDEGIEQEELMTRAIQKHIPGAVVTEENTGNLTGRIGRHDFRGRPDGLLYDPSTSTEFMYLLEYKNIGEHGFNQFKRLGLKQSHPYYYDQVQVTLQLARQNFLQVHIPHAILFAKVRGEFVDYHDEAIYEDKERLAEIEARLDAREEALANAQPPDRPFARDSGFCQNCPAFSICWEDDEEQPSEIDPKELEEVATVWASQIDPFYTPMNTARNKIREEFRRVLTKHQETRVEVAAGDKRVVAFIRSHDKLVLDEEALFRANRDLVREHSSLVPQDRLYIKVYDR